MRRKIALLCIMLPLLTCQLHAQEVNDEEEDNTEETTKVSSLLMPNAFSPNGDGINDIYKPKDGYRNIEVLCASSMKYLRSRGVPYRCVGA